MISCQRSNVELHMLVQTHVKSHGVERLGFTHSVIAKGIQR